MPCRRGEGKQCVCGQIGCFDLSYEECWFVDLGEKLCPRCYSNLGFSVPTVIDPAITGESGPLPPGSKNSIQRTIIGGLRRDKDIQ